MITHLNVATSLIAFSLASMSAHADDGLLTAEERECWMKSLLADVPDAVETPDTNVTPSYPYSQSPCCCNASGQYKVLSRKSVKEGEYGLFATGEWLFWTAHEGGMEYAVTTDIVFNNGGTPPFPDSAYIGNAHAQKVSFDWESGYRVGIGAYVGPDLWDLYLFYTHFHTDGSDSVQAASIFPLLYYQADDAVNFATEAQARSSIHFSTLDLELGREYFMTKRLSVRPHVGLKDANIRQNLRVNYSGDNPTLAGLNIFEIDIKAKNRFKGIGLSAGLNSSWYFGSGFNLFANATGALLYGKFSMEQTQVYVDQNVHPTPQLQIDLKSDLHQFSPTAQLLMGLAWDKQFCMCNHTYHIGLGTGYEIQYWWRQNQYERFVTSDFPIYTRNSEDLVVHGLTVSARFDF